MKGITIFFDGVNFQAVPGQSVGAALLAGGESILRHTRIEDKPRGMFCGIGVCFDCLVVIDGLPNQRACITEVREGMRIQSQENVIS